MGPQIRHLLLLSTILATAAVASDLQLSDQFAAEIEHMDDLLGKSAYEDVYTQGENLLVRIRAEFPDGSFDEAKILDMMVDAYYRSRRVMEPEAIEMGQRTVAMKEDLLGPDSPELANSLMHMGNLYSHRYEPEPAIPYYDRAIDILEKAGPGYDDQRAIILSSQGVVYRRLGQNLVSLELYGKALAIQERLFSPDHPDVASTLNNMAVVYAERGDYSRAEQFHRRALAIRETHFGPDHEWVGESSNNLASVLGYLGKYDESLTSQERAVRIFRDRLGTDHQRFWIATQNLGIAYLDMGDPRGALPICQNVVGGLSKRYGEESSQLCYSLDALAGCHYSLGNFETALAIYSRSLKISVTSYGAGSYDTADTIEQQGKCLMALGRLDEAVERLDRSLEIWENYLEGDNAQLCDLLNRLAEAHLQRRDDARALAYAGRSRAICARDLGDGHPLMAAACLLEGQAMLGEGRQDDALANALLAEDISRRHLQHTMRALSELRALDYAGTRVEGLNLALSILDDGETGTRVAQVWDAVIRSRSAVLDEYTARNHFLSIREDSLTAALMDSSLVLRERLANLTLRGPGWEEVSVYNQMLIDTEADLNVVERQLSLQSASFRQWRSAQQVGFEQVSEALPAGCSLVAYVRCVDESNQAGYKAFTLAASGADPVVRNLGDARHVETAVATWRDQTTFGISRTDHQASDTKDVLASRGFLKVAGSDEDRLAHYREAGNDLRRLVWDPVTGELDQAGTIFLVPDGGLHLLSFASLPVGDDRFLVESNHLLHILTSERALALKEAPSPHPEHLLALGCPDYGLGSDDRPLTSARSVPTPGSALEDLDFTPLPQAHVEVEQIGTIWSGRGGDVALLTGAEATERNLKRDLPLAQVLHLATHGFFLPSAESGTTRWDNPLVRSGLALAGANHWQQATTGNNDGILTAEEVSALDLTNVQWAVLSACDTGLGELDTRGEGVFGLRRAFMLAGARTVIMSLWSVSDESACDWMSALYRARWQDGASTAAAVKQASCAVLAARRAAGQSVHPYYWAAFVAAGDWR